MVVVRRILFRVVPILIAGLFAFFQFCSSEKFTNDAGRTARVAMSEEQEQQLGLQSYQQILSEVETVRSGPEFELVREVAARLARATGKAASTYEWQVSLVRDPQINAFCLPGGKIVVFTGILPVAQSAAGLATVMGHEMAHATARHGSERMLKQQATQTLLTGAQFSLGEMDWQQRQAVMAALGAGAQYGLILPFSRDHETEADEIGLIYMARAGYDPREAIGFWERMGQANRGQQPPEFMSTHPASTTRIERLKAAMPKAMEIWNQSQKAR